MLSSVCDQGRAGVECADNFARSYFGFAIVLLFFSRCAFEINDVLSIALSSRVATQSLECYFFMFNYVFHAANSPLCLRCVRFPSRWMKVD